MSVARPLAHRVVRHESDILDLAKNDAVGHESVKMGARRGDASGKVRQGHACVFLYDMPHHTPSFPPYPLSHVTPYPLS